MSWARFGVQALRHVMSRFTHETRFCNAVPPCLTSGVPCSLASCRSPAGQLDSMLLR